MIKNEVFKNDENVTLFNKRQAPNKRQIDGKRRVTSPRLEKIRYSWKTMSAECETSETQTETNFYPYTGLRKDLDFRSLNHDNILSIYESRLW